jgi:hypothetical protein
VGEYSIAFEINRCGARGRAHSGCGFAALRFLRFFAAAFAIASEPVSKTWLSGPLSQPLSNKANPTKATCKKS